MIDNDGLREQRNYLCPPDCRRPNPRAYVVIKLTATRRWIQTLDSNRCEQVPIHSWDVPLLGKRSPRLDLPDQRTSWKDVETHSYFSSTSTQVGGLHQRSWRTWNQTAVSSSRQRQMEGISREMLGVTMWGPLDS